MGGVGSAGQDPAELELVGRARDGEREAFDALVRAHFTRVYALLFRLVGNHEDAEDLAQECFLRAHGALRWYRGEARLSTWLARIALHLAQDHRRRQGRREDPLALEELDLAPARSAPGGGPRPARAGARRPDHEVQRRELIAGLGRAIDALPHRLRAALVLRVLEGLPYDDVARATGMRPGTVRTQVMKARRLLLRALAPWLEGGSPLESGAQEPRESDAQDEEDER